ncbi:hypothetical protein BMW22_04390 [Rhizobium leguminosarum]|uniref:Integrase n=1 Tax=Rhizobium leguminosarum TaxID=384 RepID=A0A1L3Z5Y1_RHILE|nr:hypothetical protein [Rhizobium leguminosarum]API50982.1 hypothetical protein BMW22_04390 [Rhizobium leguminosarum]
MKKKIKIEYKRWHLKVSAAVVSGPPYRHDLKVTPESNFEEDVWLEPVENLPSGGGYCRTYDFLSYCETRDLGRQSLKQKDKMLLRQLKEAMIGVKHHRHALNEHNKRPLVPKPRTWRNDLRELRRIFVGASLIGLDDIRQLTQSSLDRIQALLKISENGLTYFGIAVDQLIHLSKGGLISGVGTMGPLEVVLEPQVIDTTRAIGAQPLTDHQIQQALQVSLFYIEHAKEIADSIAKNKNGRTSERWIRDWCENRLPCQTKFRSAHLEGQLLLLVQVAAANLIGYHLGTRPSETLSMRTGCVRVSDEQAELDAARMEIAFQTFKAIQKVGGIRRSIGVSDFIKEVVAAVEMVMLAAGAVSDSLFSNPNRDREYNDNQWNAKFIRFCKLHRFDFTYSASSWRKSLISIHLAAFEDPLEEVATLVNHQSQSTTAGYATSPFILNEFNEGFMRIVRKRFRTMFESSMALGGGGLGGLQGLEIEKRLPDLFKTEMTEHDIEMTMDEFIDDLLSQGVIPVLVKPGVFCVKGPRSPGYCSRSSGDTEPDPSRCSPRCHFQLQLEEAKATLIWEIEHLTETMKIQSPSALQRDFWLNDILDRVRARPSLGPTLLEIVNASEELTLWFGKKLDNLNSPTN